MSVDLVVATMEFVAKIKGVLDMFRPNDDECDNIYSLVDTVSDDLMRLKDAPIMEDQALRPVMARLRDTIESTETEVRRCQTPNALVRLFRADDIAAKLDQLRQDISEKMLGLVLASIVDTNTQVRRMDQNIQLLHDEMVQIPEVVGALLVPLQSKLELLEQHITHSTDNARNKNITGTDKTGGPPATGLKNYSWFVFEASLASNVDIGGGHISTVYKGELNSIPVAIKKFGDLNPCVRERFVDELILVSKLQHDNIIELLGHCYEYSENLVQEGSSIRVDKNGHLGFVSRYMPNQSLVRIIKGNQPVDWPSLFRIIQGIAKGLHYLHEQCVVHLDLKPKTILLDADMTPKINDFGTARELGPGANKITVDVKTTPGTEGYKAPELLLDDPTASTKSDVYSFGVILLETISLMCATSRKGRPRNPEEWLNRAQGTELRDLFDTQLVDGELQLMVATRCVLVGLMCCLPDPAGRPSMQQVVEMLAEQKDSTNIASSSSTASQATTELSSPPLPDDLNSTRARDMEGRYKVLTQEDLCSRQKEDIDNVAELLSISPGLAAVLLHHCQWTPERVQSEWFDNGDAFRVAVGLPSPLEHVSGPKVLTRGKPNCLCFDDISAGRGRAARSAGCCTHYYCDDCWRRYISVEMDDGPRCLPLRCPDPFCEVPVVRELVVEVFHDADTVVLYDQLMLLSYVDNSAGRIQWCHGRGCSRAVEFLGGGGDSMEVLCECGHGFCWNCGKEPHRPVPCHAARDWLDKIKSGASPDDEALDKALRDMEELKHSWLTKMADTLGIQVTDLGFLPEAYEEIVECRRRIRWVHAYGYYYLSPQGERNNKREIFDRLLEEADDSLRRLHVCADEERLTLELCACAIDTEVEAISKTYSAAKTKVSDLTRETQQHFEKLVKAAETDFQYY